MKEVKEVRAVGGFKCIPARFVMAILGSVGMGIIYGLKVNFHVAIVSMINKTATDGHPEPGHKDGPFVWSDEKGLLLSAYFWGYMVAQLPGGKISESFSAKWVMFFAMAINVVATILSPVMANIHWGALIVMRVLKGLGGGVTFPGMHVMLANWAPPSERSIMSSIVYSGTALGTVIFMILSGIIAEKMGWEMVFYIQGGVSAVWLILWGILVTDSPKTQRFITQEERDMILKTLHHEDESKHAKIPYKAICKSMAFWAIFVAHVCSNWGFYMVLIELPSYMHEVLKFNLSENAGLLAAPFLLMWLFSTAGSKLLDYLRGKSVITTTTARKIATGIASGVPSICFLFIIYFGKNKTVAITLMTIATTALGGMFCGFLANHIDIASNYAGILVGATNTFATIPGIVVPNFVTRVTKDNESGWNMVFWSAIVALIIELVVYTIFGSGNEQPWNNPDWEEPGETQPLKAKEDTSKKA